MAEGLERIGALTDGDRRKARARQRHGLENCARARVDLEDRVGRRATGRNPDGSGSESDGQQRVVLVRHPADLDEHPVRRLPTASGVDQAEELALERVGRLFGAEHANVQAHSGASANLAAYLAVA